MSGGKIELLHGSRLPIFVEKYTGFADNTICVIVTEAVQWKFGITGTEADRTHSGFGKRHEFVVAVGIFDPDTQLWENRIGFINLAVVVFIVLGKVGKTVSAGCTE